MHHSKYIISKQGKKGCAVFGRCVQYVCRVWCVILHQPPLLLTFDVFLVSHISYKAHRTLCSTTFSSYFQVIWGEATNFGVSLACFLRVCIVFVIWVFFGLSETSCVRSLSGFVRDGFQRKIGANFANFQAFVLIRGRT